jgi:hypothetical protein
MHVMLSRALRGRLRDLRASPRPLDMVDLPLRKRATFALISIIVSTVFALMLAEMGLRVLGIGYGNAPLETHPILHHAHPKNYMFLSHTPSNEYGSFQVYYGDDGRTIPASEWKSRPNHHQPERACRVAFLGDSFTESGQVPFEASFVGLIARHSACELRNYGVSSYSPIFYLTQWRHEVKAFRPTLVIVQLYSNDIADDASFAKLARYDSQGLPTAIPGPPDDLVNRNLRNSYVVRLVRKVQLKIQWWLRQGSEPAQVVGGFVEEDPDISPLSSKLMKALMKDVKDSGAEFAFFAAPSKYRLTKPFVRFSTPEFSDKWKLWSQESEVADFVDMVSDFQRCSELSTVTFFPTDIHLNPAGHKIVAAALCRHLREKLGLPPNCEMGFQLSCGQF